MADPVSAIAIGGLASSALGAGVSAFGNMQQGAAQSAAYTYQAGIAQINAQIADQNARYAYAVGEQKAQAAGMQTRAIIGQTKAQQGASGLDVNVGSAVDVRASEADLGAENVGVIRNDAARTAYGYQVEEQQQLTQAALDRFAAKNVKTAGYIGAASSLLGGASSVSDKWLKGQQAGSFS
jgi:hypothetical protein